MSDPLRHTIEVDRATRALAIKVRDAARQRSVDVVKAAADYEECVRRLGRSIPEDIERQLDADLARTKTECGDIIRLATLVLGDA